MIPCACVQPGCVCPNQQRTNTTSVALPLNQSDEPSVTPPSDTDLGSLVLILFLMFMVTAKLRL
jgi:hypothetical protein